MSNTPEFTPSIPTDAVTEWDTLSEKVPFCSATSPNPSLDPNQSSESDQTPKIQLPASSPNRTCNFYLREIKNSGRAPAVEAFLTSALSTEYEEFSPNASYAEFAEAYSASVEEVLDPSDQAALKSYSGLGYKAINQVARGFWDYDILGRQTPEKLEEAHAAIARISHAISSAPSPDINFTTFRGTNLDSFRDYGINSLSDLTNLENQLFLETGFSSTSFISDHSFANRTFDDPLRKSCDITIKYHVPADSHEGVGLLSDHLSYSPQQNEFLINRDSLSYISKVEVAPDQSSAKLEMTLIPRHIYDPAYSQDNTAITE